VTKFGVCLTLIELFRVFEVLKEVSILADELMAIEAVIFLVSRLLG
jgi:hypothetical protein